MLPFALTRDPGGSVVGQHTCSIFIIYLKLKMLKYEKRNCVMVILNKFVFSHLHAQFISPYSLRSP